MARPPKDDRLKLSTDIRIPVTAAQKRVIAEAVSDEPGGMAAWARQVLIRAAQERIADKHRGSSIGTTARNASAPATPGLLDAEMPESVPESPEIARDDQTRPASLADEEVGQDVDRGEIQGFLSQVYGLAQEDANHLAIDAILGFFDDALLEGDLAKCQEALSRSTRAS